MIDNQQISENIGLLGLKRKANEIIDISTMEEGRKNLSRYINFYCGLLDVINRASLCESQLGKVKQVEIYLYLGNEEFPPDEHTIEDLSFCLTFHTEDDEHRIYGECVFEDVDNISDKIESDLLDIAKKMISFAITGEDNYFEIFYSELALCCHDHSSSEMRIIAKH